MLYLCYSVFSNPSLPNRKTVRCCTYSGYRLILIIYFHVFCTCLSVCFYRTKYVSPIAHFFGFNFILPENVIYSTHTDEIRTFFSVSKTRSLHHAYFSPFSFTSLGLHLISSDTSVFPEIYLCVEFNIW